AGTLGGVARKTRESIVLCEAAGFDTIFIETVGVGQSETAVRSMVDFFLLLMLAGAGDELQGIKRGIMEMADAIAITKADGQNEIKARQAKREYENALDLFPLPESKWKPKVLTSSSVSGHGLTDIWQTIKTYVSHTRNNTYFEQQRRKQAKYWMYESIHQALRDDFYNTTEVKEKLERFENKVLNDELTSFVAARKLLDLYFGKKNSK
ncbi:MAG: methylmalonyl Co-A mutase-associated GTPase MeaB, partial [Bacteroidota bacterium]